MGLSDYFIFRAGGNPTLQEVLVNGNIATGTPPMIFNDGAGNAVFLNHTLLDLGDAAGNETLITPTLVNTTDTNGNRAFSNAAGTQIYQQGVQTEQGHLFRTIANGIAVNITQEYTDGTGSGMYQLWTYNGGIALGRQTTYNWRDLGTIDDVAVLGDLIPGVTGPTGPTGPTGATGATGTLAIGTAVGGSIANAALYVDGANLLADNSRYTFDGATLGIPHLAGTTVGTSVAAGAGAGTGPTISITGDDLRGFISLTPGVAPGASAQVCRVTFATPYSPAPKIVLLLPANAATALLFSTANNPFVDQLSITTAQFDVTSAAVALVGAVPLKFYYFVT